MDLKNADHSLKVRAGALIAAFWVCVGLFGGTAEYLATRSVSASTSWFHVAGHPLLAGVIWIALTLPIIWGSWSYPPVSLHPRLSVNPLRAFLHGVASLGVGLALNAIFFGVLLFVGSVEAADYADLVSTTSLRLAHINAGVYWAILGAAHLPSLLSSRADALKRAGHKEDIPETLTVRSGNQTIVVKVSDISWIEGAGDYVRLHLGLANHLHSARLKHLESRLDPYRFVRVHRSAIVNVDAVRRLRHLGHGDYEAVLEGGFTVRVSRTRRPQLTEILGRKEMAGEAEVTPEADPTSL